jgi:hypothetical protein
LPSATYDTSNFLVILDQIAPVSGVVNIDVQEDLYSDGKEQWLSDLSLNRFRFPWQAIGGQTLPNGAVAPRIFFLLSPWKIRPYEDDHQVALSKNLFTEDGSNLTVPTLGDYTVLVNEISDFSSGDDRINDLLLWLGELYRLNGLDINNPAFVPAGAGTITAGDVEIAVTGDCDNGHTLTRQP